MDTISLSDVKKGLSVCSVDSNGCEDCPFVIFNHHCTDVLMARTLAFLNFYGELVDLDFKRLS